MGMRRKSNPTTLAILAALILAGLLWSALLIWRTPVEERFSVAGRMLVISLGSLAFFYASDLFSRKKP